MQQILVVDDDDDMRAGIVALLQSKGYATVEADNGMTALDQVTVHKPNLIISDVMMANMNGFMLRETLRSNPDTENIPVILISGYAKDAGAWGSDPGVEYLPKPFTFDELLEAVERKLIP
jgi:twitching motility two-component system response regulator PilH